MAQGPAGRSCRRVILSNREILSGIAAGRFNISPLAGHDPTISPFNTSAVDLRLNTQIQVPKRHPAALDLRQPGIAEFLSRISETLTITDEQAFTLTPGKFVLAQTVERVDFPLTSDALCYSGRVEGRSSLARCGILVHFTAPTIHAGFKGPITLEIANLGPLNFLLYPRMFICQLIIEEVKGIPVEAPNQFKGQTTPAGLTQG